MKIARIRAAAMSAVAFLSLAQVMPAAGGGAPGNASQTEQTYTGTITAVNTLDKAVSVKAFLVTRTFNTASDCKVSLEDKSDAALTDLRPGQKVGVSYDEVNGVRIARNIVEQDMAYDGHIAAINPTARTITLQRPMGNKDLVISPDCIVMIQGEKSDGLDALKLGDWVHVVYDKPEHQMRTACRIEENGAEFTGRVLAIDGADRSIKVAGLDGEEKFNLGASCPIVINGQLNGSLNDLRLGERVSLTYENHDGVLVADRVTRVTGPEPAQTARVGSLPQPASYGY
jgi:hypothetical protein